MKNFLMLLIAAGSVASAASITLNTYSVATMGASQLLTPPPGATDATIGATGGGGLCPSGLFSLCPSSGSGSADFLTFTIGTTSNVHIILQDEFLAVDVFDVVLYNGTGTGSKIASALSSQVPLFNNSSSQSCFVGSGVDSNASAFNSCLNWNAGTLAAGTYSISIEDVILSYLGLTDPYGGGTVPSEGQTINGTTYNLSPAHFGLEVTASPVIVPEPATFALLGLGGIGLGLLRRRIVK